MSDTEQNTELRRALAHLGALIVAEYEKDSEHEFLAEDIHFWAVQAGVFRGGRDAEISQERMVYGMEEMVKKLTS